MLGITKIILNQSSRVPEFQLRSALLAHQSELTRHYSLLASLNRTESVAISRAALRKGVSAGKGKPLAGPAPDVSGVQEAALLQHGTLRPWALQSTLFASTGSGR